jgi:hypothetical protein
LANLSYDEHSLAAVLLHSHGNLWVLEEAIRQLFLELLLEFAQCQTGGFDPAY